MTAWQDRLLPASFRGVAIDQIETMEISGGRRGPLYEYASSERAYRPDTGLAARRHSQTWHLLGDDAELRAAALIAALETPGQGLLVHPTRGRMLISILEDGYRYTVQTSSDVRIAVNFVETGPSLYPAAVSLPAAALAQAGAALKTAAAADFSAAYDVAGRTQLITRASRELAAKLDTIRAALTGPLSLSETARTSLAALAKLTAATATVVLTPSTLAADMIAVFDAVDVLGPLEQLTRSPSSPAATLTGGRVTAGEANRAALDQLVSRTALARAGELLGAAEFSAYQDATAAREQWTDRMRDEEASGGVLESVLGLRELRGATWRDLTSKAADLGRLRVEVARANDSVFLVAQRLYGDARRFEEILERNAEALPHPTMIPLGTELWVLES